MAYMVPKEMLEFDPKSREDVIFKALRGGLNDKYWVFAAVGRYKATPPTQPARKRLAVFLQMGNM